MEAAVTMGQAAHREGGDEPGGGNGYASPARAKGENHETYDQGQGRRGSPPVGVGIGGDPSERTQGLRGHTAHESAD